MKNTVINFVKKESVLVISTILAAISCFIVKPDAKYGEYIDISVLGLLFSLMAVMAGFRSLFVFTRIGQALLSKTKTIYGLSAILIYLCFFSSMAVTNDVALITFVPFSLEVLTMCDKKRLLIPVIVLQTVAANLGSMLTPPGNPQNLYLYSISGMSLKEFIGIMLPFTIIAFIMLGMSILFLKNDKINIVQRDIKYPAMNIKRLIMYIVLFVICLAAVVHIVPFYIPVIAVVICLLISDRRIFSRIDYGLLLTFVSLFVLVGNMARIHIIYDFVSVITKNHPFAVSVSISQIISNVPAALLISGFSNDYTAILKGVNIGGLGTIIASMASLISYKIYAGEQQSQKGRYMVIFTVVNMIFLFALCGFQYIIG